MMENQAVSRRLWGVVASWATILVVLLLCDGFLIAPWLVRHHPLARRVINSVGVAGVIVLTSMVAYGVVKVAWASRKMRREITEWNSQRPRRSRLGPPHNTERG